MNRTNRKPHDSYKIDRGLDRCIYCGSVTRKRSSEHLIAYALDGRHELSNASCEECAKITALVEQQVARVNYGNFRLNQNSASREKRRTHKSRERQRNMTISVIHEDGSPGTAIVPSAEFPLQFTVPLFGVARILTGESQPDTNMRLDRFEGWLPEPDRIAFQKKYRWDGRHSQTPGTLNFARMLAKIGHVYAIAELGTEAFSPLAENIDLILGRSANYRYTIGRSLDRPQLTEVGEHSLGMYLAVKDGWLPGEALLCTLIQLYRGVSGSPIYHVAVGHLNPADAAARKLFDESVATSGIQTPWYIEAEKYAKNPGV